MTEKDWRYIELTRVADLFILILVFHLVQYLDIDVGLHVFHENFVQ